MAGLYLYLGAAAIIALLLCAAVAVVAYRTRHRWRAPPRSRATSLESAGETEGLSVQSSAATGDASGHATEPAGAMLVQVSMVPIAAVNIITAVAVALVLAPVGALASLIVFEVFQTPWPWNLSVGAATLGALPLALLLVASGVQLVRRSHTAVPFAVTTGIWALLHAASVLVTSVHMYVVAPVDWHEMLALIAGSLAACVVPAGVCNLVAGLMIHSYAKLIPAP